MTEKLQVDEKVEKEKEFAFMVLSIFDSPMTFIDLFNHFESLVKNIIKNPSKMTIDELYRAFHTYKAQFSRFHLSDIADGVHHLEEILGKLRMIKSESTKDQLDRDEIYNSLYSEKNFLIETIQYFKTFQMIIEIFLNLLIRF